MKLVIKYENGTEEVIVKDLLKYPAYDKKITSTTSTLIAYRIVQMQLFLRESGGHRL